MNADKLVPAPAFRETFRRNRERFIHETSGCYTLTNFSHEIMYIGLAKNLRRRFVQHLDTPEKTAVTKLGRAMLFWWYETADINKVERTWMNIHLINDGSLPILNSMYSPTAI